MRPAVVFACLGLAGMALGQTERQIAVWGGYNETRIPRSEDPRRGAGLSFSIQRPEPRVAFGPFVGRLRYEAYYLGSTSPGPFEFNPDRTDAVGAFAALRVMTPRRLAFYGDVGFGVQYASQASYDIPLAFNTTPTLALGVRYGLARGRAVELGFRYLHVSNGGRKGPNGGQNWLLATLGFSF